MAATLMAFIWAGSRGGFLALVAVAAFLLFRFTGIPARWRILATAAMTVLFLASASDAFWDKMGTTLKPTQDYNYTDSGGRLLIWQRGIDYMLDRPVLGVGAGNFGAAEGTLSASATRWRFGRGLKWSVAHNSFVQAGAELGIPGLLLFVSAIAGAFIAVRRVRLRRGAGIPPGPARLAQALTASILAFVVGGFFLSLAYSDMLYVLLALAAALGKVQRPQQPQPARRPFPTHGNPRRPDRGARRRPPAPTVSDVVSLVGWQSAPARRAQRPAPNPSRVSCSWSRRTTRSCSSPPASGPRAHGLSARPICRRGDRG